MRPNKYNYILGPIFFQAYPANLINHSYLQIINLLIRSNPGFDNHYYFIFATTPINAIPHASEKLTPKSLLHSICRVNKKILVAICSILADITSSGKFRTECK